MNYNLHQIWEFKIISSRNFAVITKATFQCFQQLHQYAENQQIKAQLQEFYEEKWNINSYNPVSPKQQVESSFLLTKYLPRNLPAIKYQSQHMDLHFLLPVLHVNLKNPQKPKQRPQTNTINPKQNQHLPAYYDVCVFLSDKRTKIILSEENLNFHTCVSLENAARRIYP